MVKLLLVTLTALSTPAMSAILTVKTFNGTSCAPPPPLSTAKVPADRDAFIGLDNVRTLSLTSKSVYCETANFWYYDQKYCGIVPPFGAPFVSVSYPVRNGSSSCVKITKGKFGCASFNCTSSV